MTGLITPERMFALALIIIYLIFSSFIVLMLKSRKNKNIVNKDENSHGIVPNFHRKDWKVLRKLEEREEGFMATRTSENKVIPYDSMSGEEFELYVAKILDKMGFCNISLTKGSGDQGVDIVAEKDRIKYAVQCKRYSQPVGNKAVQQVFAGVSFYHCHVGVVVTNNYFTNAAKDLAYENGVILWDKDFLDEYASLIEESRKKEEKNSYEIINAEEKIVAIKNNKAGKVLYQYLLSSSRNAIAVCLKNGDGTQCTDDMARCIKKPIQLYNSTFDSFEKNIYFNFYCEISQEFKKTSSYKEFVKNSEKKNKKYKDDLFEIKVIYSIDNIVLEKGKINIEYRPNIEIFTTTMEKIKELEDIGNEQKVINIKNKTYYRGYVTENIFPMKISNIRNK